MIFLTGATGHFGKATIETLLQKGVPSANIIGLARNEEKAKELEKYGIQFRIGDYDDVISLVKAFQGIEKLLFISGSDVFKRDAQHVNVIDAAMEAKVPHIIYTSFFRKDDSPDSPIATIANTHINTERNIIKSGITYTFLQNALYAEAMPMFLGPDVTHTGIYTPAGDGKAPFTTRKDLAEAAANVLIQGGHENKYYKTVNIENYSFHEIARLLTELTGKEIHYMSPDPSEYKETLKKAGMPDASIAGVTGFIEGIRVGYFEADYSDLEILLGRKPAGMKEILKAYI
ncbi:MAG: SDR family oxidoreductase [Chloroflexota bacterium]